MKKKNPKLSFNLENFIQYAGKSLKSYDYLMSKEADSDWDQEKEYQRSENDPDYAKEDEDLARELWAKEQQTWAIDSGDPSMHFGLAKLLPKDSWLIHFTNADPRLICGSGFLGRDVMILGLTTHWKEGTNDGDLALAFKIGKVSGHGAHFGKYGKNAVLFQAKQSAEAYHYGDEEHQVVFDIKDAYNFFPLFGDQDSLILKDLKTGEDLKVIDRNNDALEDLVNFLNR